MTDYHLASGDSMRITIDAPDKPILTLPSGNRVFLAGGRGNLRARTRDDALTEGVTRLLFRRGPVRKRDLEALLDEATDAVRQVDLT